MILLLGASGYLGQSFAGELRKRGYDYVPLSRKALDYSDFNILFRYIRRVRPEFLINVAGFTGKPNADACEAAHDETLAANTLLPQTVARVCAMTNTPWAHVSSGAIYTGAKVFENGGMRIERDLNGPDFRRLLAEHPENVCGFTEFDEPNFSFACPPCNYYSGTKALGEQVIQGVGQNYIWRPGIPFSEREEPRNLLWRLQRYPKVWDSVSSISHVEDFVRACLNLWERRAPLGIYNITNPGAVTTRQVVEMIQRILKPDRPFHFWKDDEEFYRHGAKTPRSSCILDVSKLLATGVDMRPVEEALENSLHGWRGSVRPEELVYH